jgi:lipoate-protein ligase A
MWHFLDTGFSIGAANMAVDERLAVELSHAEHEGVVRVYGWEPPCISLGYHQTIQGIDLDKCHKGGVDVVRRPTGGRTVLHWEELTYSVILRADGQSLTEMYHHIGLALERGLRRLNNEISLSRPDLRGLPSLRPTSAVPCYASIARFEIQYRGKKLVGSAQRRFSIPRRGTSPTLRGFDEIVLQHGSILIGPAHRRLVEFLAVSEEAAVQVLKKELEEKSTELSTILNRKVEFEEVAQCVRSGFEEEWGVHFAGVLEGYEYPLAVH